MDGGTAWKKWTVYSARNWEDRLAASSFIQGQATDTFTQLRKSIHFDADKLILRTSRRFETTGAKKLPPERMKRAAKFLLTVKHEAGNRTKLFRGTSGRPDSCRSLRTLALRSTFAGTIRARPEWIRQSRIQIFFPIWKRNNVVSPTSCLVSKSFVWEGFVRKWTSLHSEMSS